MKKRGPLILGLTGSIGMGKSTAVKMFARLGLAVWSADKAVHELMGSGGRAVKPIAKLFPAALDGDKIDRKKLAEAVLHDKTKLRALEAILHPLVWKARDRFLAQARKDKAQGVVLEIPLLFETKADRACDISVCVTASQKTQKARVMKRRGMTPAKLKAILRAQMPDREKRARADVVIKTDKGLADTRAQIQAFWAKVKTKEIADA